MKEQGIGGHGHKTEEDMLTEEEKQKAGKDFMDKLSVILAVNGLALVDLDAKMLATLVMVYQEGLKTAKEILLKTEEDMRTIKFRAWDKKKEIFVIVGGYACEWDKEYPGWLRLTDEDRFELMQFTGLLDKNGKEIYEGDIIKGEYPMMLNKTVVSDIHEFCGEQSWSAKDVEVIGNIYENPELLKTEEV